MMMCLPVKNITYMYSFMVYVYITCEFLISLIVFLKHKEFNVDVALFIKFTRKCKYFGTK